MHSTPVSVLFVLGTPVIRESDSTAILSAHSRLASALWWLYCNGQRAPFGSRLNRHFKLGNACINVTAANPVAVALIH